MQSAPVIRFGAFELNVRARELRKHGVKIKLQYQPLQLLALLLEQPGQVVTREDIHQKLWPTGTFVDFDHGLNAAIQRLRQALGDSAENPRFVETLARHGYRFIAPVADPAQSVASLTALPESFPSLAVLPFVNADGDPEVEYLADGITETIINNLSRLPGIRVMARSTVIRYNHKSLDPRSVGHKLKVQAVLSGRVMQRGEALLVGAELVEVQNGWQLWGEQYSRKLADIFAVEDEISHEVSRRLLLSLTREERSRLTKRHTESSEAYQDYLKGRYHLNRLTEDGLRKSIEYFQRAIERDPNYALAYAGLADSYQLLDFFGLAPAPGGMPQAKEAARRAIGIDDNLAEAHTSLAGILKIYDWDWFESEREHRKAIELNPNDARAHRLYASYLATVGRPEESRDESRLALELEPFSLAIHQETAYNSYMAREYTRALQEALRTLELEPHFAPAQCVLGQVYEQQGRYDEALAALENARITSEGHPATLAVLAHVLGSAGRMQDARVLVDQLTEMSRQQHVSPCWLATAYTGIGETVAALDALDKAYQQRDVMLIWVWADPLFDALRADPRFNDLLQHIGLPPRAGGASRGA